ncbi:hypothetical protein ACFL20_02610 [Spirochaetota bacterium]
MNYKDELRKISKHRERYFPVMLSLLRTHDNFTDNNSPVPISKAEEMAIILELIDIGYINIDAFIIKREFEDVTGIIYNGENPLTNEGYTVFRQRQFVKKKNLILTVSITIILIILLLVIINF